ncbi:MAG: DUF5686 and carboxypeptidase regulatory-like domain-containing protein [Capnocytophaga sp.]|nr:DUF5686 and carboxypeptidase regulatory-like domain-containing protein [Capnocytophaga sp.]
MPLRNCYIILFVLSCLLGNAQIQGTVANVQGEPIPFVNIYAENGSAGTTTNENGQYTLDTKEKNIRIVFQYLGYKTVKKALEISQFPHTLDVVMDEESYLLPEVVVSQKENPAVQIIRNAIANRAKNSEKTNAFEADFYSKGIIRVKNIPNKILGFEVGDLEGNIDSTRAGIVYQSETISKLKFEKPDKLNEQITASKVAGNSQGYSFNTAQDINWDFYDEYVTLSMPMISPIADKAFAYYRYTLDNTFYDADNQLINRIKVIPRRDKEPVFEGYIYIVEDSWAVYGIDLIVKGYRMQEPMINELRMTQNFRYDRLRNQWNKNLQTIDFDAGILGMNFGGKFSYVYSNYIFKDRFESGTFGSEIARFDKDANTRDSLFWQEARRIPLTEEETVNYRRKDSIETLRNSKPYLDSLDAANNKFKWYKPLTGYTLKNSFAQKTLSYAGIVDFNSISFNTVQGWNISTYIDYEKRDKQTLSSTYVKLSANYGFAERRLRPLLEYRRTFNRTNQRFVSIELGNKVRQYNPNEPITPFVNSISTLFFRNNYMKLYDSKYVLLRGGQELTNGLFTYVTTSYDYRSPLHNHSDYSFFKRDDAFTSNNPQQPDNDADEAFGAHGMLKTSVVARLRFGQKYVTYPNRKIAFENDDYPTLTFRYTYGASPDDGLLNFHNLMLNLFYTNTFGNKGILQASITGELFFHNDNMSFVDYKHFNGNRTHVQFRQDYKRSFYLLPYYTHSTNRNHLETHFQHDFNGFAANKLPLFNKLQWNFVVGFHQLIRTESEPYRELTFGLKNVGFGKLRLFRIDYVRAYQNGYIGDGLMFGINL